MVYKSSTNSGGGGSGTVTEVDTGSGLTGGPITTTGTIDISPTYPGQSSITTVGTIGTGVWQGTKVGLAYGGTDADLSATGGTSRVLKQTSSGAAVTVAQLAASDLSNGTTGSTTVVLSTSPSLTTPNIGVATATSVNGLTITSSTGTLTVTNAKVFSASNTITLAGTDGVSANVSNLKIRTIGFSTTSPTTGQQGSYVVFPVAGTITGWNIVADAGTATVKVWKIATGTTAPTISNVINTSGVSLASGTAIHSSTVSDFTTTVVSANDILAFDLTAVATATKLLFELEITVT